MCRHHGRQIIAIWTISDWNGVERALDVRMYQGRATAQPFRAGRSHSHARLPLHRPPRHRGKEPEHCHDWCWLIRPAQAYFLTTEQAVVCPDCVWEADAIRLADGLTLEIEKDRLLVRRGDDVVEVLPREVRHVVDALVGGYRFSLDRHSLPTSIRMPESRR
jgi:hypothetical protein